MRIGERIEQFWELCSQGSVSEALAVIDQCLGAPMDSCDRAGFLIAKAVVLVRLKQGEQAKQTLEELKPLLPSCAELAPHVEEVEAEIYAENGDPRKALRKFDSILDNHRDSINSPANQTLLRDIQISRADLLSEIGEFDKARTVLEQILPIAPNNPGVHYKLGFSLRQLREFPLAKIRLRHALDLGLKQPHRGRAEYELGFTHYKLKEFAQAIQLFEKCLGEPEQSRITKKQIYNSIAACYQGLGMNDEAEKCILLSKRS